MNFLQIVNNKYNKHSKNVSFLIFLAAVCLLIDTSSTFARYRFEEGDWIAWGESRMIYDIEVGRNTVFIATDGGVLRWDRNEEKWLYPWFSVPGPLDNAFILRRCRNVLEDPLTLDLYVLTASGWYMRNNGTARWEEETPSKDVLDRAGQNQPRPKIVPSQNLIAEGFYSINQENELVFRLLKWQYAFGAYDQRSNYFFGWNGFGIGIAGEYTNLLKLYPMGPGAATSFDVIENEMWCASMLDREGGWVWRIDRNTGKWSFFTPDQEWGLEPGKVNRLRIGENRTVWLATNHGVMYRSGNSWRHVRKIEGLPRDEVIDIAPLGKSAWVATEFGLARIAESSGVVLRPDPQKNRIAAREAFTRLASDKDTLWAAGSGIIMKYDDFNGWRSIKGPYTIASATAATALYAKGGLLAIGDRLGFAWLDSSRTWQQVFSNQWKDGTVLAIAFHGGYFWLGTDRGLVKYDPVEKDAILYSRIDGLAGSRVTEILPEGDWLWLGTEMALVRFLWNVEGRLD